MKNVALSAYNHLFPKSNREYSWKLADFEVIVHLEAIRENGRIGSQRF